MLASKNLYFDERAIKKASQPVGLMYEVNRARDVRV